MESRPRADHAVLLETIYSELMKVRQRKSDEQFQLIHESPAVSRLGNEDLGSIEKLTAIISQLVEQDFDYKGREPDGKVVLIKDNLETRNENLNPIHPHEADLQFLRYLRGMVLIAENIDDKKQSERIKKKLKNYSDSYFADVRREGSVEDKKDVTLAMADKFADLLAVELYGNEDYRESDSHLEYARRQVTMARDLGILMEDHPVVCTVSTNLVQDKARDIENEVMSIERSTLMQVSGEYYRSPIFTNISQQSWFQSAKKLAGLKVAEENSWLDNVFKNGLADIAEKGVPAPPSARWLPIPANTHHMETLIATRGENGFKFTRNNDFVSTGIIIPYDIRKLPNGEVPFFYQEFIATAIIKEVIRHYLVMKIEDFKRLYQIEGKQEFDFPVNYQTLLSPLMGESLLGHVDNNGRFVALAKKVMETLDKDVDFKNEFKGLGANLVMTHDNAAINRNEKFTTKDAEDKSEMRRRNTSFRQYVTDLRAAKGGGAGYIAFLEKNPELALELESRTMASDALSDLLDHEAPFNKTNMEGYQYNINMAVLNHLAMGKQGLSIDGCKSTRDRTATFGCGSKTMLENPAAMWDWGTLKAGIILSLQQGHYFRAMSFHSGVVKVALVHEDFMRGLPKATQADIKALLVFSKKLSEYAPKALVQNQSFMRRMSFCLFNKDSRHPDEPSSSKGSGLCAPPKTSKPPK